MAGMVDSSYYQPPTQAYQAPGHATFNPQSTKYRSDAGQNMTDEQYTAWQEQQRLAKEQGSTDIATNAQKGLAQQQFGFDTSARTQTEQLGEQTQTQQAGLQAAAEQRRLGYLPQLSGFLGGGTSSGGSGTGGAPIAMQPGGEEDSARQAAFARAKDTAAQTGRAALNSLNDVMGARGLNGSGMAVNQAGGVIGEGARQLGDVNREQLIQSLANSRARASEKYQGEITQRGQTLQHQATLFPSIQGLITARY